jgi:predicted nuclease of predicted toxin-antitoxin system
MKLLFDQNLSFRRCEAIIDVFPDSIHVRHVGMAAADDRAIWEFAERNGYTIVSQDADFAEMAILLGSPPKVIWIRAGNLPWLEIRALLRRYAGMIAAFDTDEAVCLEIY